MSSCGTSLVQNSVMPYKSFRISPACGQVSSIVTSLCCPRNLTVVLLRSVRPRQKSSSSCIGSNSVRLAIPCTLTQRPLLFLPVVSFFIAGIFLWSIRSMQGFCVGVVSFWCSVVRCVGDPRMYVLNSNCHMWHGRLYIRQN